MSLLKEIFQRIINKIAFIAPGGSSLRPWLQRLRGVHIGKNVWISQYVYFDELHPEQIFIGDNCSIGLRVSIFSHFYWGRKRSGEHADKVTIDNDVYIGPHSVILPNVHIGEGSVIKACTVVTRNVPKHVYWGANSTGPLAQVTTPLTSEHEYRQFVGGLRPIRNDESNE